MKYPTARRRLYFSASELGSVRHDLLVRACCSAGRASSATSARSRRPKVGLCFEKLADEPRPVGDAEALPAICSLLSER
jgi:hypothetical protein